MYLGNYDTNGYLIWNKSIEPSYVLEFGYKGAGIKIDSDNNIYIGGYSQDQTSYVGVWKCNNQGELLWKEIYAHGRAVIAAAFDVDYNAYLVDEDFDVIKFGPDSDDDDLSDWREENEFFTDPQDPDSDNDGLTDGEEVYIHSLNPLDPDFDDDGITDGEEVNNHATDQTDSDTDDDGWTDSDEIDAGTDPLDETDYPNGSSGTISG